MTAPISDARLSGLMDLMQKKHVAHLAFEGISIELHPSAWAKSATAEETKPSAEVAAATKQCHCGHMPYEHNELGCLLCTTGCEPPEPGVP